METEVAYSFFNRLKNDHFCLAYMGEFDDELTASLMRNSETSVHEPLKFKKRLSFLIAECFQNIIRHADKPEIITRTNKKPKIFLVRNVGNDHYISSTNLIANTKKEGLKAKLKEINILTKEELRTIYLWALANNEFSERGGGGLGLIELARKSEFPLEFEFEIINYYFSVFYIQVRFVTSKERHSSENSDEVLHINDTKDFYNAMLSENVLMIRKGDFSQASILPLIGLIESNLKLQSNFSGSKKRTMYLLIELLQNVSKHAVSTDSEREGIFMISERNNNYVLTTGNYIDVKAVDGFRKKLESIVDLDKDQLIELYKKTLLKKEPVVNDNAGIGLIEMSKYSSEKIKYNFKTVNETLSFFSLSVTV